MEMREKAYRLWHLLDWIDTLDDACKSDNESFRNSVRLWQQKRFEIMSGEEWDELHKKFGKGR